MAARGMAEMISRISTVEDNDTRVDTVLANKVHRQQGIPAGGLME
jgi:hypothetical protein